MRERVLGERQLNRALLARQLLLDRAALPLPKAVERIGGIQAQYAPSAYVGQWSRLVDLDRGVLTTALERRTVVQGTLLRGTIHIVSRADYWPVIEAVREAVRAWWLRTAHHGKDAAEMAAVARDVRAALEDGPRRRKDVLGELGLDGVTWTGMMMGWVDMVRVPPSGTWDQRRADLYGLADQWVGPSGATADDGVMLLLRRYLGGFGPASTKDIQSFTGLPVSTLTPALDALALRRFRDERGGELLDLPRAPLPDPETPAPVRFLGTWDATLLVHARRTQILPERFRPRVFNTKLPHSVPTFLVDGQVAGTWRQEQGRILAEPFDELSRAVRRQVDEEAERLAAFHA